MDGVERKRCPPKSCGYLNMRKKYRCPTNMPISSIIPLEEKKNIKDLHFENIQ